jgi:hypothetical protein
MSGARSHGPVTRRNARRGAGRWARAASVAGALLLAGAAATPVAAQGATALADRCPAPPPTVQGSDYCPRVAHAIGILQPRLAVLAAGGNPVPGTASTLGTRLGSLPRISVAGRLGGVTVQLPAVSSAEGGCAMRSHTLAIGGDAAVGVFPGFSLLPTVGGFGSIDALGSAGFVLPTGGLAQSRPFTWAAGARLGIVRESFTMPGISVSGMYRAIGDASYGDPVLQRHSTHFEINRSRVLSVRAAASKRLLLVHTTAGVGWDRTTSNVSIVTAEPPAGPQPPVRWNGFRSERGHAFVNAAWTALIFSMTGEFGVQAGGDAERALVTVRPLVERRGYYGSLAARMAI